MKIRTKKCHWGEGKDFPIKGHILFEDNAIYDVVDGEKCPVLRYTPGMWFDSDKNSYLSFEIIED